MIDGEDGGLCEWFALCDHPATMFMPHPILGRVPICDRCAARVAALDPDHAAAEPRTEVHP